MKTSMHLDRLMQPLLWVVGLLLLSVVVQATWNMVVPEVFGLSGLRYPQAVALLILAGIGGWLLRGSHRPWRERRGVQGHGNV